MTRAFSRRRLCAAAFVLSGIGFGSLAAVSEAHAALGCRDIPDLMGVYFRKHVAVASGGPEIGFRTADTYLRRQDPQRSLVDRGEAEKLRQSLREAFKDARTGKCKRLLDIHKKLISFQSRTESEVKAILGAEDYAVDETAELVLDPDERERPKSAAERKALLETLTHFQISNYLANDLELAEAKRRLTHRHELRVKRLREQTNAQVFSTFLDAFAASLDPHSSYLSADDLEDFRIGMQLSLEGIGVALSERDGYAVVEQIIPGGAADRLEVLRPQDKIIAVAEEEGEAVDVIDMALRDVVRLIRGRKGSTVHLTVLRQGDEAERFPVSIVRDKIDLDQQAAKLDIEEVEHDGTKLKLGVLELPSFYGDRDSNERLSSRDVRALLEEAREAKVDGLLFDLSRNGGGLLEDAVAISGLFVREGGIVAVKDGGKRSRVMPDPDSKLLYNGPLVVLVSRVSASASEIVAGALRDYNRAVIVGDSQTFGKGTVQSVFPLQPGLGALRITTALFFRPGGDSTQKAGVASHFVIPSRFDVESIGESKQRYVLPEQRIPEFLSDRANAKKEQDRFKAVTPDLVKVLAERSRARVEKDEELQEVVEDLAEREGDDGVVVLSELVENRQNGNGESVEGGTEDAAANDDADDKRPPQTEEALRVLADLVLLSR